MTRLYGASPDEFMTVRAELAATARAAGDGNAGSTIGKLRKPSLAAWAVNLVARESPGVVTDLADLGARMRVAQGRLDTATLTSLRPERDAVVAAFVEAARDVVKRAGRSLSATVEQDVRATVIAALADEVATIAVTSGQLTRALSYSGFGEVDLSEAVARTSSGAILSLVPRRPPDLESPDTEDQPGPEPDASTRRAEAVAALERADQELATAAAAVDAARTRAEQTRERLDVVERQLAKAREADERALEQVTDAVRRRKAAQAARHTAEAELEGQPTGD